MYTDKKFVTFGKCKQLYLRVSFTVLGLLIMPVLDALTKIEALLNVLFLPLCCCKRKGRTINQRI